MPETISRKFRLFSTAAVAAVILVGVLLKADRYAGRPQPDFSAFKASFVRTLQAAGWHQAHAPASSESSYRALTFRHSRCARALTIAVLGYTPGLAAHVRHDLGEVDLIQDGREVTAFDIRSLQAANFTRAVFLRLGLAPAPAAPLLAIAPPSDTLAEACPNAPVPLHAGVFGPTETASAAARSTTIAAWLNSRQGP